MKKLSLVFLLTAFLGSSNAGADVTFDSGNSWLVMCGKYPIGNKLIDTHCEAYTQGVIEGFMWGYMGGQAYVNGKVKQAKPYCLSSSQTLEQYILVIRKTMYAAPESLDKPAPWLIHAAMSTAFPCEK